MKTKQTIGIVAIALLLMTITATVQTQVWAFRQHGFDHRHQAPVIVVHRDVPQKSYYERTYELGWAAGYKAHVDHSFYLNLALSPGYAQGYSDGWNAYSP